MRFTPTLPLACAALVCGSASCPAAVTLVFSIVTQQATNWANSAGDSTVAMPWGIIVDRNGDGLASSYQPTGINFALAGTGQSLVDGNGAATDDLLYMSSVTMTLVTAQFAGIDGAVLGQNRITTVATGAYLPGMNPGDALHLIWFDSTQAAATAPQGTATWSQQYGIYSNAAFALPADDSPTTVLSAPFIGTDPQKTMNFSFVPEPSHAVLGLLSAGALTWRRRRR